MKQRLLSALLLVLAAAVLSALGPVALKIIVDDFASHGRHADTSLMLMVALYVVSQWLARVAAALRALLYGRVERRVFRTISERLFAHLMHLPLQFHLNRQSGAISQVLDSGLEGFQIILNHLVFTILPVAAQLGTVILVLSRLAPPPFLALFCAALVCYIGAFTYSAVAISERARTASTARVAAGAAITDGLLNYEVVKYFTGESIVQERVAKALALSESEWVAFYRHYAGNGLIVAGIFAAFLTATTCYATVEVHGNKMTIGDFVLVNTYILQLVQPVELLGYALQGLSQGLAMLEKMLHLFREPPETDPQQRPRAASRPGNLEFDRVGISYRAGRPTLENVSFRLQPHHTLGIVGPSGSGKSTIVRLLMRLLDPDEGQIMLNGVPIRDLALPQLRRAIAIVPQDSALFNDTIAFNVAFGRLSASHAEVQAAARIAHLHEFIMSLPQGYDTVVGERGVRLSGGERQRVAIARAILKCPDIYVFDEATSSLDSGTEHTIVDSLKDISTRSTALVIAHRLSTVFHADEIIVLEAGIITERGVHADLLRKNGTYMALWKAQHQGVAAK